VSCRLLRGKLLFFLISDAEFPLATLDLGRRDLCSISALLLVIPVLLNSGISAKGSFHSVEQQR